MSSHDISISTPYGLQLSVVATVGQVIAAFNRFLAHRDDSLKDIDAALVDLKASQQACLEFAGQDDDYKQADRHSLVLQDGKLMFSLDWRGPGHGADPNGLDDLREDLASLLAAGGVLEIIDHDVSAANKDEAVAVRFIGRDNYELAQATVQYGLDQAREYLEHIVGPEYWQHMSLSAIAQAKSNGLPENG